MGACFLFSSLAAKPKHAKKNAPILVQQDTPQQTHLTSVAKDLTLNMGIPLLLYQNSYTHIAVYPYLWKQCSARVAIETLTVNSMLWFASSLINQQENTDNSTENSYGYKAAQCATVLAADFLLRQTITKPFFTHLFGSK